jgi:hypothetical protein
MRSDMKRLLGDKRGSRVSGPRKGKRFSPAEFRKTDWDIDDAPFVAGLVGHGLEKSLIGARRWRDGYNSKPMERYLSSQVGRLWNDVFSEIRAELRRSEIAEARWHYLLSSIVAIKARLVADEILVDDWSGNAVPLSDTYAPKFYVDPLSGRLHRNTSIETPRMHKKRVAANRTLELASRMRSLSPTCQLHLLSDRNWWEVTLKELDLTHGIDRFPIHDVVLKSGLSQLPRETLYGRPRVFACAMRALSSREIKRYRLR